MPSSLVSAEELLHRALGILAFVAKADPDLLPYVRRAEQLQAELRAHHGTRQPRARPPPPPTLPLPVTPEPTVSLARYDRAPAPCRVQRPDGQHVLCADASIAQRPGGVSQGLVALITAPWHTTLLWTTALSGLTCLITLWWQGLLGAALALVLTLEVVPGACEDTVRRVSVAELTQILEGAEQERSPVRESSCEPARIPYRLGVMP